MNNIIFGFYADKFDDSEWSDSTGWNTDRFIAVKKAFDAAVADLGMDPTKVFLTTYRYGPGKKDLDSKFDLVSFGVPILPQILFAVPDPTDPDQTYHYGQNAFFLAKLGPVQISQKNIGVMLKTVQSLEWKNDPTAGVQFYDPTLHLLPGGTIGFNPAQAPGGYLIGLGLTEETTINRTGQQLTQLFNTITKALPWVIGAFIAYEIFKKK